jgi:hypothetical protein
MLEPGYQWPIPPAFGPLRLLPEIIYSGALDWLPDTAPYLSRTLGDSARVLRNLTKRVFVRSDTLNEIMLGYKINRGLGRLLIAHTCWSTDPSISMHYNGLIHRGVWAGDQFDIVQLQNFHHDTEATEGPGGKMSLHRSRPPWQLYGNQNLEGAGEAIGD